ncbi:MAG: Na+/H+ antiporter NhaA [Gemmatimonadaceae bacterium]
MSTSTASSAAPPLAERVLRPFQQFAKTESSGGIVLMVCTALALAWANSPWSESYFHLWEQPLTIGTKGFGLTETLHRWINDGLMAVFFFLVGLEIKREMLVGELATVRKAALPIAGAIGGMIVPAALYMVFNRGGPGASGWAIPMATDIAFALGVLALLGSRVPASLKVFLAALAIADDIGAVLVIAFFYTSDLSLTSLGVAAGVLALLFACGSAGVRRPGVYAVLGVILWIAMLKSGIHATVAGVLLAMTIPARTRIDEDEFVRSARASLRDFEQACGPGTTVLSNHDQQEAIHALETACEEVQAPLLKVEHKLHSLVAYGIMPLFAFANAGIRVGAELVAALSLSPGSFRGARGTCRWQAARYHAALLGLGACGARRSASSGELASAARGELARRHRLHNVAVHRHARVREGAAPRVSEGGYPGRFGDSRRRGMGVASWRRASGSGKCGHVDCVCRECGGAANGTRCLRKRSKQVEDREEVRRQGALSSH